MHKMKKRFLLFEAELLLLPDECTDGNNDAQRTMMPSHFQILPGSFKKNIPYKNGKTIPPARQYVEITDILPNLIAPIDDTVHMRLDAA